MGAVVGGGYSLLYLYYTPERSSQLAWIEYRILFFSCQISSRRAMIAVMQS